MNADIRLNIGWRNHPKIIKLHRRLGSDGVLALVSLWTWVGANHPDGDLDGMDAEDIALAAQYPGDAQAFLEHCLSIRLVDRKHDGSLCIHDWEENNPWAFGHDERQKRAKKAAKARWQSNDLKGKKCVSNAKAVPKQSYGYAPSPSPSPSPSPTPTDQPVYQKRGSFLAPETTELPNHPPANRTAAAAVATPEPAPVASVGEVAADEPEQQPESRPEKKDSPIFLNNLNSTEQQIQRKREIRRQLEKMGITAERLEPTPNKLRAIA